MYTKYEQLLDKLEAMGDVPIRASEVRSLVVGFLDGQRIVCNDNAKPRRLRKVARDLIRSGVSKPDTITALMTRFSISRAWANFTVNKCFDQMFNEVVHSDRIDLTAGSKY